MTQKSWRRARLKFNSKPYFQFQSLISYYKSETSLTELKKKYVRQRYTAALLTLYMNYKWQCNSLTSSRVRYKFINRGMLTVPHITKSHTQKENIQTIQNRMDTFNFSFVRNSIQYRMFLLYYINIFIGHIMYIGGALIALDTVVFVFFF